jgi:hypothetical protein
VSIQSLKRKGGRERERDKEGRKEGMYSILRWRQQKERGKLLGHPHPIHSRWLMGVAAH